MITTAIDNRTMPTEIKVPSSYDVNYHDVEEVCGYQLLLAKLYERAGGMSYPPKTNAAIRNVQAEGRRWLREVKFLITSILEGNTPIEEYTPSLGSIPSLLSAYDFMYRICNGCPCFDYLRDVRLKTVEKWTKGDRSITTTDVALIISDEMDRDIRSVPPRYLDFFLKTQEKWITELETYGTFRNLPLSEAYARLRHLLKKDLFVYLGSKDQDKIKTRWATAYAVNADSLHHLDTQALKSYILFSRLATLLNYVPSIDSSLLYTELSTRPDLNPHYREALLLDLEIKQKRVA